MTRSTVANDSTGSAQLAGLMHRSAEGDDRRDREFFGRVEQGLHLVLPTDGHRGDHSPEAFLPRRKHHVPHERVHGRAARERVARQVAIDGRERAEIGQHHQQHRHLVEVLGEAFATAHVVGRRNGAGLRLSIRDRSPGRQAHHPLREVLVPGREVQIT
ncbi:MAG: hypothetical protein QOH30_4277 [Baekduia sp.]|nr:hypothetical protein [Baekduia sp.]